MEGCVLSQLCIDVKRKKSYKNFDLLSLECPDPAFVSTNGVKESPGIRDRENKVTNLEGFISYNA